MTSPVVVHSAFLVDASIEVELLSKVHLITQNLHRALDEQTAAEKDANSHSLEGKGQTNELGLRDTRVPNKPFSFVISFSRACEIVELDLDVFDYAEIRVMLSFLRPEEILKLDGRKLMKNRRSSPRTTKGF